MSYVLPSWAGLEASPALDTAEPAVDPTKELQKSFVRVFSTNDGEVVLADLRARFLDVGLGPTRTDAELRHVEGQRCLMRYVLNQIERGKV